jgi:hypothetical protein
MTPTLQYCPARLARLRGLITADPSVEMTPDSDAFARLAAESEALKQQEAGALAADTTSDVYRQYVDRLHEHIVALAAYLGTPRNGLVPDRSGRLRE